MTEGEPEPIRSEEELDAVLEAPLLVLYKHSPLCGLSAVAAREITAFMRSRPDVPVRVVDVIRSRPLSRAVEVKLGIRHESPQALVLRDGQVVWHGSHGRVTAELLDRETA